MGRIRISGKRDAAGRLVGVEFRKGAGSFTLPVRDEHEHDDNAQRDQRRRMTFAEWCEAVEDRRQTGAATAQRVVRCSVCSVVMPAPPSPISGGICLFDTCQACIEARRSKP